MKIKPLYPLILAIVLYTIGILLIPQSDFSVLKKYNLAEQDEYTYYDSDGEEHEGSSLVVIANVGKILTYKDVYFMSLYIFVLAMFFGSIIMGKGPKTTSLESLQHIIFANCILGVVLIILTQKQTILPTIFFWFGIISAYIASQIKDD